MEEVLCVRVLASKDSLFCQAAKCKLTPPTIHLMVLTVCWVRLRTSLFQSSFCYFWYILDAAIIQGLLRILFEM